MVNHFYRVASGTQRGVSTFFQWNPSVVSLQQRAQTEAHATFTTEMANVLETPTISGMHVTDVMGPTPGMIALPTP